MRICNKDISECYCNASFCELCVVGHLSQVRSTALKAMSAAYGPAKKPYPVSEVQRLLCFESAGEVGLACALSFVMYCQPLSSDAHAYYCFCSLSIDAQCVLL